MTIKDKLEIGLKEDAPYRKDNLPDAQVRGQSLIVSRLQCETHSFHSEAQAADIEIVHRVETSAT